MMANNEFNADLDMMLNDVLPEGSFEGLTFMSPAPIEDGEVPSERFEISTSGSGSEAPGSTDVEMDVHDEPILDTFYPVRHIDEIHGPAITEEQRRAVAWDGFCDFRSAAWAKHAADVKEENRKHAEGAEIFEEFTYGVRAEELSARASELRSLKRSRSCADLPSLDEEVLSESNTNVEPTTPNIFNGAENGRRPGLGTPGAPRKVGVAVRGGPTLYPPRNLHF